jgi:hypothetical protein
VTLIDEHHFFTRLYSFGDRITIFCSGYYGSNIATKSTCIIIDHVTQLCKQAKSIPFPKIEEFNQQQLGNLAPSLPTCGTPPKTQQARINHTSISSLITTPPARISYR